MYKNFLTKHFFVQFFYSYFMDILTNEGIDMYQGVNDL